MLFKFIFKKLFPIYYAKYIGVSIGENCRLINVDFSSEPYLIQLGNHVSATAVRFETHDGGVWTLRGNQPEIDIIRPIIVGSNVFIGYETIIMPGVKIGDNVVIGARSVVTKDIPSNVVAAGVPAKIIKTMDSYEITALKKCDYTKNLNANEKKKFYLNKFSMPRLEGE